MAHPLASQGPFGGVLILPTEPNAMYIGGSANSVSGAIYRVALRRDGNGHISGWGCFETIQSASAPFIDGGLCLLPGGVMAYATYSNNTVGQILPGQNAPASIISLSPLGVVGSTGALLQVPEGFPGAGRLKIVSYLSSTLYDTTIAPAGDGTFTIAAVNGGVFIGGGPEGLAYVHGGNPNFAVDSILVSEYSTGSVAVFDADTNGDPIPSTRRVLTSGFGGAEGATIDPLTGDFIFSSFGGANRVIRISGFTDSSSCIGDLNADQLVDGTDLGILLGGRPECPNSPADLKGDSLVDGTDLGILLSAWGPCS
ncbi:MAG: hypothetical protein U0636_07410 [Phycisphaerales bacterium]